MAQQTASSSATSFVAPGGTTASDVVALLTERLAATSDAPAVEERTVLDTPGHEAREAGVVIEATRIPERGMVLGVRRWGRAPDRLPVPHGALPRRIDDLPPRLAAALPKRIRQSPLVAIGTAAVTAQPLAVRNDDDKVVVRAAVESVNGTVFVRVQPVRGYDRAGAAAIAVVRDLGFRAGAEPAESLYAGAPATAAPPPPPIPAHEVWVGILRELLDEMERHLPGAIEGADPEDLHDFRVALRRTRAALRHAKGVLPAELISCFRPELTHLQRSTGPVRDLEVLVDLLDERADAGLAPLRDVLSARLTSARAEMVTVLRADRTRALLADWRATLSALADAVDDDEADEWGKWPKRARSDITDVVSERIARQRHRLLARGRVITSSSPADAVHDVRKQGKDLRYLVELFAEHVPDTATPDAQKAMRSLQNNLGRHHDLAVQLDMVRSIADSGPWTDRAAIDALLADLTDAQQSEHEKFPTRFARAVAHTQH